MRIIKRIAAFILCFLLLATESVCAFAAPAGLFKLEVSINGEEPGGQLSAYNPDVYGNTFISLMELSKLLKDTEKQFCFQQISTESGNYYALDIGKAPQLPENFTPVDTIKAEETMKNSLLINGEHGYYSTFAAGKDLFMNLTDVQICLNLSVEREGNSLKLYTNEAFSPDIKALREDDFFSFTNGVVLGDANTGRIIFSYGRLREAPIASLTKLMTYLLVAEAEERGEISYNDSVPVTEAAAELSHNPATLTIYLNMNMSIPVSELVSAMFIASSNESALLLAEYVAGSEESFVAKMNERAAELGLKSAKFYNTNGLPSFSGKGISGKRQNKLSANDLFTLSSYILNHFPEVTEITAHKEASFEKLGVQYKNSNHLVFNMNEVNGLKTGYTNRAGYCISASMPVTVEGITHNLVTVVLGSETSAERDRIAEILLIYGKEYCESNGF